jgi:hypothetical protein
MDFNNISKDEDLDEDEIMWHNQIVYVELILLGYVFN